MSWCRISSHSVGFGNVWSMQSDANILGGGSIGLGPPARREAHSGGALTLVLVILIEGATPHPPNSAGTKP